mmetsp:Transcript_15035/g.43417  ORF Transcript_15035/g.43417 Transcript_15035/m.43417 type:complete len:208 (+) Transcript_15035:1507-2130(+)
MQQPLLIRTRWLPYPTRRCRRHRTKGIVWMDWRRVRRMIPNERTRSGRRWQDKLPVLPTPFTLTLRRRHRSATTRRITRPWGLSFVNMFEKRGVDSTQGSSNLGRSLWCGNRCMTRRRLTRRRPTQRLWPWRKKNKNRMPVGGPPIPTAGPGGEIEAVAQELASETLQVLNTSRSKSLPRSPHKNKWRGGSSWEDVLFRGRFSKWKR